MLLLLRVVSLSSRFWPEDSCLFPQWQLLNLKWRHLKTEAMKLLTERNSNFLTSRYRLQGRLRGWLEQRHIQRWWWDCGRFPGGELDCQWWGCCHNFQKLIFHDKSAGPLTREVWEVEADQIWEEDSLHWYTHTQDRYYLECTNQNYHHLSVP